MIQIWQAYRCTTKWRRTFSKELSCCLQVQWMLGGMRDYSVYVHSMAATPVLKCQNIPQALRTFNYDSDHQISQQRNISLSACLHLILVF